MCWHEKYDRLSSVSMNLRLFVFGFGLINNSVGLNKKANFSRALLKSLVSRHPICVISRRKAYTSRTKYEMDTVYLRRVGDSQDLYINFRYTNKELGVDRDFNFCRKMQEKIEDALVRIQNNIQKELNKKANKRGKKKASTHLNEPSFRINDEISVEILRSEPDEKVENMTFAKLLEEKLSDLKLRIVATDFKIAFNLPWVLNLNLPTNIMAGFRVYPTKVELQFADQRHSLGKWYITKMPLSGDLESGADWKHCGDGFYYNTTNNDIGYILKFRLTPKNEDGDTGPAVEQYTKKEIQAGPGVCPFEMRHCFTKYSLSGDSFRVASYNILADLYADSDFSRTHLFPYCPPYALKVDYRKQLYLKELIGYNADIMCLQEVDLKIFDFDLKPIFESNEFGYHGTIAQKGTCGEGVAIFFRKCRFDLLNKYELNIGESIRTLPQFKILYRQIENNKELMERICDRSTTIQVVLLKCKDNGRYLIVANTHLYFHPDADHIRLLQMGFAMIYLDHIYREIRTNFNLSDKGELSILFCGDFNSVPECGIYKLMKEGTVEEDCVDWISNTNEAVKNVTLTQPFNMKSACGTPLYTNYTHSFAACLDYIFYQSDFLEVQQVVPLPTEEELNNHTAIPSVVFPSDHVALVADIKFK